MNKGAELFFEMMVLILDVLTGGLSIGYCNYDYEYILIFIISPKG